jgi:anaerobic selenocysteine-containing dehydrogenase
MRIDPRTGSVPALNQYSTLIHRLLFEMKRKIKTVCPRDCYDSCFVTATVGDDGKIESVKGDTDHPLTRGFTCPRGNKDSIRVYSNRILFPQIRTGGKPGRSFRKASWSEALDIVAESLKSAIRDHGSESVLLLDYAGYTGLLSSRFSHRLWNAIGAAQTDEAICSTSGHKGLEFHYGLSYGIQPEELLQGDLIVFWGFNAPVSSPHIWSLAIESRRQNGTRLIAIDPRESECARSADIHAAPRPGSDVALAMGICRSLIENGQVDLDFIEKETTGFEQLKEEALSWSAEKVHEETGLEPAVVEQVANAYAVSNRSATMVGIGFQKNRNGADLVRAASFVPALRGLHRGFYYTNGRAPLVDKSYLTGESIVGIPSKTVSQVALSSQVQHGDFSFLFIYSMNPVQTLPNQVAFRQGLKRSEVFTTVHETHWTETTDYADVILPAPTFLEKQDIVVPWSHRHVRLSEKVIDPLGESRDEVWVMTQLSRKLGLSDEWLYEDPWKALEIAFEGAIENGSFQDLFDGKSLLLELKPPDVFQTPSGKIEFYSNRALELGMSPLPEHRALRLGPDEFHLLNTATRKYTNTQFRESYGPIPEFVLMNPQDADLLGVSDDQFVKLENDLGRIKLRVKVSDSVPPRVLWSPRQLTDLEGRPMNDITSDEPQPIGQGSTFNSTVVTVRN